MVKLAQLFQPMSGSADDMDCRYAIDRCRYLDRFYSQGWDDNNLEGVKRMGRCFRAPLLPLPVQSAIRPAAACRILSASSELITPSLLTSAAEAGRWIK